MNLYIGFGSSALTELAELEHGVTFFSSSSRRIGKFIFEDSNGISFIGFLV